MTKIVKPSIPSGFLELLPEDQIVFNNMLNTIRDNYEKKGFLPIDTPVMEKSEVLLAKGGGETEKQIYEIKKGKNQFAMRFDLTVPLARYVAEHISDLSFPFRRYHIGKVYRGERAQKGRFREFYQCDIDIIGNQSLSLFNDAEIPSVIESTFEDLGFSNFTIHINNRKLLTGFYKALGINDSTFALRTVDKLDKIGAENVKAELIEGGLKSELADKILEFMTIEGSNEEIIDALKTLDINDEEFLQGLEELNTVLKYIEALGIKSKHIQIDLSIARGLDYYTGTVYETTLDEYPEIGSVCSGGRYENLASHYTKQKLPGVGISIGLSRLYYQLNEAGLLDKHSQAISDLILIPLKGQEMMAIKLLGQLRENNVDAILYSEGGKIGKKFKYADQLDIPYVMVIGPDEVASGAYTLRNMANGEEALFKLEEIIEKFKK